MSKIFIALTSKRTHRLRNNTFSRQSFPSINPIVEGKPSKIFTFFKQDCHFLSHGTLNFFFTGTNNTSFFKKITAQALSFIKREKLHPKE
jgi:hypothetical protein